MATITINDLPVEVLERLRNKATKSGLSLEDYARQILQKASSESNVNQPNITELAQQYFGQKHGVELDLPERSSKRESVDFI